LQPLTLPPWFGLALFAFVCAGAVWKGEWEERGTAYAFLLAWGATMVLRNPSWLGPQWGVLFVDVVLLAFLIFVALKGRRYWPVFAAGFHLLAVATHAARMADPVVGAWAYATASIIFSQMTLLALAAGVATILLRDRRERVSRGA
jgi:signal transduction histidine kinase